MWLALVWGVSVAQLQRTMADSRLRLRPTRRHALTIGCSLLDVLANKVPSFEPQWVGC
jgi:hypothetical protein